MNVKQALVTAVCVVVVMAVAKKLPVVGPALA